MTSLEDAVKQAVSELERATEQYGPFHSAHEGYAIIKEEFEELWEAVKMKPSLERVESLKEEATQVAAMAIRLIMDCC